MNDFTATIRQDSARDTAWHEVFGSNTIPIRSPITHWAQAPGITAGLFYEIDVAALSAEQRDRMVAYIAATFGIPASEVDAMLDEVGCPILADDVTVTVRSPQRWL